MPCYRCGTLQADPEAGKSSPWRRGVVREHQVLICPACQPSAIADLTRCSRCGSVHLIKRLDQVECLDCRLVRDAAPDDEVPDDAGPHEARPRGGDGQAAGAAGGASLAAEVASALDRVLHRR